MVGIALRKSSEIVVAAQHICRKNTFHARELYELLLIKHAAKSNERIINDDVLQAGIASGSCRDKLLGQESPLELSLKAFYQLSVPPPNSFHAHAVVKVRN